MRKCIVRSQDDETKVCKWVDESALKIPLRYIDNSKYLHIAAEHFRLLPHGEHPGLLTHGVKELVFRYRQFKLWVERGSAAVGGDSDSDDGS